jgi:cytochrome c oxidase cbb3-type subunit III
MLLKNFSKLALMAACAVSVGAQNRPAAAAPPAPAPKKTFGGVAGDYKEYDPAVLENGKKTFSANCAFCHGSSAKGGESGPDLLRSLVVLHDENGEGIAPVVRNGRPDKGMPKFNLSIAQISEVAAFLHDQVRAAAMRGTYQILNIVVGNPKAGEAYFNGAGRCTGCHSVTGDLAHIGSKYDAVTLQQKILMPREGRRFGRRTEGAPDTAPIEASVTLPSGETVNGKLEHIDDFNVSLIDGVGERRSFSRDGETPKVELHDPLKAHIERLKNYTDSDIHDLTAYLLTLK